MNLMTRRAGLFNVKRWTFKCEGERNDHMLYYEQVFGNAFESRESKCCAVLMKHRREVKSKQVLIIQMNQQLKTKNISDVSGRLFCCQCEINFCYRQPKCIDDQDKFQSVKILTMNSLNVKH